MTEDRIREIFREEIAAHEAEKQHRSLVGLRGDALRAWAKSEGKIRLDGTLYEDLWKAVDRGVSMDELVALVEVVP